MQVQTASGLVVKTVNEHAAAAIRRTALPWTGQPDALTFALSEPYLRLALENSNIRGIIIPETFEPLLADKAGTDRLVVVSPDPTSLFYTLHESLGETGTANRVFAVERHIAESATIHPTAVIGRDVHIGENVHIGEYAIIKNQSVLCDTVWVGPHCLVGEEALFRQTVNGASIHIPAYGGVWIGRGSRLYGHNVVCKSNYLGEYTRLGEGAFLGFQASIGHDSAVGDRVTFSTKVTVAGRVSIGDGAWLGAGSTISQSLTIGTNAFIAIGSVVISDVKPDMSVSGNFAIEHKKNLENYIRSAQ